jgi:hypothetical protein
MKLATLGRVFFAAAGLLAGIVSAQAQTPTSLPNSTLGFGDGQLLRFVYSQNFDCIDQPKDDLNFNGIPASMDPAEMQTPICQVGINPSISPSGLFGDPAKTTEPLYVLVPMFSADNDQNPNDAISCTGVVTGTLCGPQLGSTLITLFGAVPEAFKAKPLIYTQCPEPGAAPGTCTMHASRLDLAPALAALGLIPNPPTANVFLPTPNHSHVVLKIDTKIKAIWWQVIPVLVLHQSDWPSRSEQALATVQGIKNAEAAGRAVEVPSNFFLFFNSKDVNGGSDAVGHDMAHMGH